MTDLDVSRRRRRGAKAYFAASVVSQICALARYTILARFLGPEQLGLAATLILTIQFFQSISDSGSDRFLIQDRLGDEPSVQRLVQAVFVARGLFTASFLAFGAAPIAAWLGHRALAEGLIFLAIYPVIAGLTHLDMRRAQRASDFRPEARAQLAGEISGLIATGVAAYITRDFTAVIYGLVVRSIVVVASSHRSAERPYSIGFSQEHSDRLRRFAIPLLANGLLLFIGSQGDRVIVGQQLGFEALGLYTAVLLLIFYPTGALSRFMSGIHLPQIAAEAGNPAAAFIAIDRLGGQTIILGVAMCVGFVAIAPIAIPLLYGSGFRQPVLLIALIGILQTSRFIRLWPATAALAIGRSGIVLTNNLVRMLGLPIALVSAQLTDSVAGAIVGFIVGEVLAFFAAIALLNRALARPRATGLRRMSLYLATCTCILGWIFVVEAPTMLSIFSLAICSTTVAVWLLVSERDALKDLTRTLMKSMRR